ncbi:MAG: ATP-dependent Clp protease proteolytic subunit [Chloroflexota bacterium]|jgi:ATP-dependent Clp protease protease subunit|nr:ATP-dependent Clp protease proteolytic subunit [Chloroflexota bacterium]MDP6756677.1 ATP-dependent Clp protease proteolytic subunit [Chloroflexota bacterium]|tara:strand:+ start:44 stop:637 length:594 start_codon:yes stop_codon:yes gene_type:complete
MGLVPNVIETTERGERGMDIYSRLLRDRVMFLGGEINTFVANTIVAQLLLLQSEDPERDISLYVNSGGGEVDSGMAIYDTMQYIEPDVQTVCVGMAASMGALVLAGGTKGKRFALPSARVMIHQPMIGIPPYTRAADIEIESREVVRMRQRLEGVLVKHTNQSPEKITADTTGNHWMNAEEALEYGIIDQIVEKHQG